MVSEGVFSVLVIDQLDFYNTDRKKTLMKTRLMISIDNSRGEKSQVFFQNIGHFDSFLSHCVPSQHGGGELQPVWLRVVVRATPP